MNKAGLYYLHDEISADALKRVAESQGFTFYCIDGGKTVDEISFLREFEKPFPWPEWAKAGWIAGHDVIADLLNFPEEKSRIILFDDFHVLAKSDPRIFFIAFRHLQDIPVELSESVKHRSLKHRAPFYAYTFLRGEKDAFRSLPAGYRDVPDFLG